MTVGALVCPALVLIGYLAIELSRREFSRLAVIEAPDTAWRHLPHVFDRYYRVTDHDGRSGGTGLGLAIVRKLVAFHGGTVTAPIRPEDGMVFSLTLPREIPS